MSTMKSTEIPEQVSTIKDKNWFAARELDSTYLTNGYWVGRAWDRAVAEARK